MILNDYAHNLFEGFRNAKYKLIQMYEYKYAKKNLKYKRVLI